MRAAVLRLVLIAFLAAMTGAISQAQIGATDQAAYDEAFQRAFADPTDLDKIFAFAELAARIGDDEGAIAALERMLLINANLPRVRLELGLLYLRRASYQMARNYLTTAMAGDSLPPPVRQRAQSFIDEIDKRARRHQFSGTVFAGLRYQSNANAGPSGTSVRVSGVDAVLDDRFTAKSDWNVFAATSLAHVYDLGTQGMETIETKAAIYSARQIERTEVDVDVIEITSGPRFNLAIDGLPSTRLRPYAIFDYVRLDDGPYYWAPGAGLSLAIEPGLGAGVELRIEGRDRRYRDNAARPRNTQRDGIETATRLHVRHELAQAWAADISLGYSDNQARDGAEANAEYALGASLSHVYEALLPYTLSPWRSVLSLTRAVSRYDRPDPFIDAAITRQDLDWRAQFLTSLSITEDVGLIITLGLLDRNSSLRNYETTNRFVSLGVSWRF